MLQQSGPTVAETLGQTQQIMFSANIGHARTLVLQKKPAQVDAYGANLHDAKTTADAPGGKLRPLPDNFLMVAQFVVTSKGEDKKMAGLNRFIADVRANGFVSKLLERTRIPGLAVSNDTDR